MVFLDLQAELRKSTSSYIILYTYLGSSQLLVKLLAK